MQVALFVDANHALAVDRRKDYSVSEDVGVSKSRLDSHNCGSEGDESYGAEKSDGEYLSQGRQHAGSLWARNLM
jgi:hypothetical protein